MPPMQRYLTSREFRDAVFRTASHAQDGADAAVFMPPERAIPVEMMALLMPTMPYSSALATRQMRPMSRL
jgi:hypothetical protein